MTVQARADLTNVPFIRSGITFAKEAEAIEQDAARAAVLAKFTVMAKKNISVPVSVAVVGTGNGTMTAVAVAPGASLLVGDYELEFTFAVTNGGVFKLTDPNGNIIADNIALRVGAGLLSSFSIGGLVFTITDGSTDFAAADVFTLPVTAVNKWVPLDPAGAGGEEIFAGIYLGDEITAAALVAADIANSPMLVGGACTVDLSQLVYENSAALTTLQVNGLTIEQSMAQYGIFAESTTDIDGFEN